MNNKINALNIQKVLEKLNKTAVEHNIPEVKINIKDPLIAVHGLNNFINNEKYLKSLKLNIFKAPVEVVNEAEKAKIIENYHNSLLLSGHSGYSRTLSLIKAKYWWKTMSKEVLKYVKKTVKIAKLIDHTTK